MSLLSAQRIEVRRSGAKPLFKNLNFEVRPGEVFQILGANGSGKSTLLSVCAAQLKPTRGKVKFSISPLEIAYVPQLQNLESHLSLTLAEVVKVLVRRRVGPDEILSIGLLSAKQLGLAWNTASGGERQRVLLTSALLNDPRLLCLDEPLNHLDFQTREALLQAMTRFLNEKSNRSIVLVSHLTTPLKGDFSTRALTLEAQP